MMNIPGNYRAGKPPTGMHLDVLKEKKLIQKLMVDDKRCYLFGRNSQLNDFCIDHQGLDSTSFLSSIRSFSLKKYSFTN